RPTLRPACHLVPRWRARILPASTISPPVDFKPSRRPAESRPFREDPPAFLCAMSALSNSVTVYTDSMKESSHFFLPFVAVLAGFFAAGFLALVFALLFALAGLASASPSAVSLADLGLGSRCGRGGGVFDGLAPSVRISVMRVPENSWR